MTTLASDLLLIYFVIGMGWLAWGLSNYHAMRTVNAAHEQGLSRRHWDDAAMRSVARFTLSAPIWPLAVLWTGGRAFGRLVGNLTMDASRKVGS